jgi:endonuclease/exonuclease/phosphatase family metal-dependent hydrolase
MAQRKKSLLDGFIYFFNLLAAIALLLSYLAYYVDPQFVTFFAFFGLAYPVILLANLLFILYWILRRKNKLLLSIVCIAIGYLHLMRVYQFTGSHKVVNPGNTLKVMTYNVRLFNNFNWLEINAQEKIAELVAEQNPDVLLLQEYHFKGKPVDFGYPHRYQIFKLKNSGSGLTIFSKFPLLETGSIRYGLGPDSIDAGRAIYADISFENQKVRLINAHLASVGLNKKEYDRIENPNKGNSEEIKNGFLKIGSQLNYAFIKRAHQVKILEQGIMDSPYPTIVAGDFNDTPTSYAYHLINESLKDAYLEAGSGFSKTYANSTLPLRIDHIFFDTELEVFNYEVIAKEYSDHYPVVATFEWR